MTWIRMNRGAGEPAVCLFPPIGGGAVAYTRLASALRTSDVYGVSSPGLFGDGAVSTDLREQATAYLAALPEHLWSRPLVPCGWCYGALTALEAARQLTARGARVARVVAIEPLSVLPGEGAPIDRDLVDRVAAAAALCGRLAEDSAAGPAADGLEGRLVEVLDELAYPPAALRLGRRTLGRMLRVTAANLEAALGYAIEPAGVRVTCVVAAAEPAPGRAPGGWETTTVPGRPGEAMLRSPQVEAVAAMIGELIAGGGGAHEHRSGA